MEFHLLSQRARVRYRGLTSCLSLFYEDNRNQFSWFLFAQFGVDWSHVEVIRGVNGSVHLLGF